MESVASEVTKFPYSLGLAGRIGGGFGKAHADDAAYDLYAVAPGALRGGDRVMVDTDLRMAIPEGFAGLVLPRSGLAAKHGVTVLNAPGLIDPGYRGKIGVVLARFAAPGDVETFRWQTGDRIAQLLLVRTAPVEPVLFKPEDFDLLTSERGAGGFGSTG